MEDRKEFLALLVEEYRQLGAAGIQANQHLYTTLQWGTAVVGIIVGAAISQWGEQDAVVELVFLIGVPALVAVGMLYWVGELARIDRLTAYIGAVEAKIELALEIPDSDSDQDTDPDPRSEWLPTFRQHWSATRVERLADGLIEMPVGPEGPIEIESGPIAFERWLRKIRYEGAANNLAWVYLVRILLFPSVMAASWVAGVYYVFWTAEPGHLPEDLVAMGVGLFIGAVSTWFVAEVVTGLGHSSARDPAALGKPRRAFRKLVARPLRISEWR